MYLPASLPIGRRRALSLLVVCLLLAGCENTTRSVAFVDGTIDTFDDGDHLNTLGNPWQAIAEGEGTYADMYFPNGGFSGSGRFLVFDGVRPDQASGAHVVGVRTSLLESPPAADPDQQQLAADVGGYQGLSLAIKGTPGTYIIQLGSTLVDDFDYYNAYVEVGSEWSAFQIPFDEFQQEGFGRPVPWNPRAVSHIAIYANLTGTFRFSLDDVRFY